MKIARRILNLRYLPRTGWVLRGVPPSIAESVADHLFLTSFIALGIAKEVTRRGHSLDIGKVLVLSIIHDIPEAMTGDIVRHIKRSRPELFNEIEARALEELGLIDYRGLFEELEELKSAESIIVKISDDLSTLLEGQELLRRGFDDVKDIVEGTKKSAMDLAKKSGLPALIEIVEEFIGAL